MKLPDYSKCQMYKIVCNDVTIKDCYVGHTCNWINRKYSHSKSVKSQTNKEYNVKKAVFIRENGGWDNWSMVLIENYPCENKLVALQRERYWIEILGATLNITIPLQTDKEYKEKHIDKIIEYQKEYRDENKDKIKEYKKAYREKNKDKIKASQKEWYQNKITSLHT